MVDLLLASMNDMQFGDGDTLLAHLTEQKR